MWRLAQSLTAQRRRDIKHIQDDLLFNKIGISADRWDWRPKRAVHERENWYPHVPGYGDFLGPPYEIGGNIVRGGPGR